MSYYNKPTGEHDGIVLEHGTVVEIQQWRDGDVQWVRATYLERDHDYHIVRLRPDDGLLRRVAGTSLREISLLDQLAEVE